MMEWSLLCAYQCHAPPPSMGQVGICTNRKSKAPGWGKVGNAIPLLIPYIYPTLPLPLYTGFDPFLSLYNY